MKTNQKLLSLGAGAIAISSVLAGGIASFTGAAASSTTTSGATTSALAQAGTPADRTAQETAYIQKLASKLGVSEATLRAALKSTNLEVLAQAVADGKITQAEADAAKARIEAGTGPLFGIGGGHRGGPGGGHGGVGGPGVTTEALATFLGTDAATLNASRMAGKSLATIATEAGKTRDQLKAFLTAEFKTHLDAEVAAGEHTQAEADTKLAEFTANLDAQIDGIGGGPGRMGGGRRG